MDWDAIKQVNKTKYENDADWLATQRATITETDEDKIKSALADKIKSAAATAADSRSVLTCGLYFQKNNHYRTELSILNGWAFNASKGKISHKWVNSQKVDQKPYDDLFIDFQAEMTDSYNTDDKGINGKKIKLLNDADIDILGSGQFNGYEHANQDKWNYGYTESEYPLTDASNSLSMPKDVLFYPKYEYRVHVPINIDIEYPVRKQKDPPDPLLAMIEMEPIKKTHTYDTRDKNGQDLKVNGGRHNMSTVRQIIINVNVDNYKNAENSRPIVFFYEGPEIPEKKDLEKDRVPASYDAAGNYIGPRKHLPVILNLHEDFRGILFAPNNPVVVNGNGHQFEGFVVAKYFTQLTPESSFVKMYKEPNEKDPNGDEFLNKAEFKKEFPKIIDEVREEFPKETINNFDIDSAVEKEDFNVEDFVKSIVPHDSESETSTDGDESLLDEIVETLTGDENSTATEEPAKPKTIYERVLEEINKLPKYYKVTEEIVKYDTTSKPGGDKDCGYTYENSTTEKYTYTYEVDSTEGTSTKTLSLDRLVMKTEVNTMFVDEVGNVQYTGEFSGGRFDAGTFGDSSVSEDERETRYLPNDPDEGYRFNDDLKPLGSALFNVSSQKYNSFGLVHLVNYTYLFKTEKGTASTASTDVFYTSARAKHID